MSDADDAQSGAGAGSIAEESARLLDALRASRGERPSAVTSAAESGECHCDRERGPVEQVVCGFCPVCRVASFIDSVDEDLIDGLADLAAMAAVSLREFARSRRESSTAADGSAPGTAE